MSAMDQSQIDHGLEEDQYDQHEGDQDQLNPSLNVQEDVPSPAGSSPVFQTNSLPDVDPPHHQLSLHESTHHLPTLPPSNQNPTASAIKLSGFPSLPVLPRSSNSNSSANLESPHLAYPSTSYAGSAEAEGETSTYAQQNQHDQEQPYGGYPEDSSSSNQQQEPTFSTYAYDPNVEAAPHGNDSDAGTSNWVGAEVNEYIDSIERDPSEQQQHFDNAVGNQYAQLVSQEAVAAIAHHASYYQHEYPSGEDGGEGGGAGEYSGGASGIGGRGGRVGDGDELDSSQLLNGNEHEVDGKGKKREADGIGKKEGGRRNTPKERKLGPDGKPKLELACLPCRQRKIRCDSTQPSCSTCTRRSIECTYPEVRKFRGPGRKKQPQPNIHLNPDGSVRTDSNANAQSLAQFVPPLPSLDNPNDPNQNPPPVAPPRKPRKSKAQKLAEEAEAAALAHQQTLQDEQQQQQEQQQPGMEDIQHHLLQQHRQHQLQDLFANGNGAHQQQDESVEGSDDRRAADALMAEVLVGAASLGGMAALSAAMVQAEEGGEGSGGPEGEYPRPGGEELQQELDVEAEQPPNQAESNPVGELDAQLGEQQVDEEMAQPAEGVEGAYVEHLEDGQQDQHPQLDLAAAGEEERDELEDDGNDGLNEVEAGTGTGEEEDV